MISVSNAVHLGRNWLSAHGIDIARGVVLSVLFAFASAMLWQLLSPLIRIHATAAATQDQPDIAQNSLILRGPAVIAHIQNEHLFGNTSPSPAAAPVLVADGSITVLGIVYSPEASDSVALLTIAGNAVVCHIGTRLPTGQTVAGIEADRVQLSGGAGMVSLLLDIPKADPDQRINPGQYAGVSGAADNAPDAPLGGGTAPMAAPQPGFAPTQFVSLKSLRGGNAAQRFSGMDAPKIKGGPQQ